MGLYMIGTHCFQRRRQRWKPKKPGIGWIFNDYLHLSCWVLGQVKRKCMRKTLIVMKDVVHENHTAKSATLPQ